MVYLWHRPLSTMYGDNYRYGTSLYSPSGLDVERKYRSTLSRTHLRRDRGDLGLYTFAGSYLHGGSPAGYRSSYTSGSSDLYAPTKLGYDENYYNYLRATTPERKLASTKTSSYILGDGSADLYSPMKLGYDENYYNYLRATTPERKPLTTTKRSSYILSDGSEYQTSAAKVSTDYDSDLKKTTTTTTTERWVPLTTYIYNTPYHTYCYRSSPYSSYTYRTADDLYSYNYLDDYKRSTYTTKSKNVDALDLSVSTQRSEKVDYNYFKEKCNEIHSQLEQVSRWVSDAETKIKTDVMGAKSKIQNELSEVTMVVHDTTKYNEELQRVIKRQARQITSLNSQYDEINRHLTEVTDALEKSRQRCQSLQGDLSSVHSGLELALKRRM